MYFLDKTSECHVKSKKKKKAGQFTLLQDFQQKNWHILK